ncbi:hypothetical protein D3OALGB2SA_3964 [Olavius algarvensis associated proteobacterium Delta 3]|nr:hypothetical protein D3OALGB2SA_3964 [Olavius algarvensis associated proteobacterium Delta 3]
MNLFSGWFHGNSVESLHRTLTRFANAHPTAVLFGWASGGVLPGGEPDGKDSGPCHLKPNGLERRHLL